MELWQLYLMLQADSINNGVTALLVITSILLSLGCPIAFAAINDFAHTENRESYRRYVKRTAKTSLITILILIPITMLMPSTKTLTYMIGGYYVTNIEGIKDIPPNVLNMMNKFMEEYIEDDVSKPTPKHHDDNKSDEVEPV